MVVLLILLAVTTGATAAVVYGSLRWQKGTDRLQAWLQSVREPVVPAVYHPSELSLLPPPVQRYFMAALTEGQRIISTAHLSHTGMFNMGETTPSWRRFSSKEIVTTRPPGFNWDARIRMVPGLSVFVYDAYVAGEGMLRAELLGVVPLTDVRGTPEVAQGELLRYLAEAMWYPTALLPSQGVRWTAIDDNLARATLTDKDTTVSLDFRFGADGLIESSYTAARPRTVAGAVLSTPWSGRYWDHQWRNGMCVPIQAEVSWLTPDGPYPYWRGQITDLAYEYGP